MADFSVSEYFGGAGKAAFVLLAIAGGVLVFPYGYRGGVELFRKLGATAQPAQATPLAPAAPVVQTPAPAAVNIAPPVVSTPAPLPVQKAPEPMQVPPVQVAPAPMQLPPVQVAPAQPTPAKPVEVAPPAMAHPSPLMTPEAPAWQFPQEETTDPILKNIEQEAYRKAIEAQIGAGAPQTENGKKLWQQCVPEQPIRKKAPPRQEAVEFRQMA